MSNVFSPGELIGLLRAERMGRALEEAICYRTARKILKKIKHKEGKCKHGTRRTSTGACQVSDTLCGQNVVRRFNLRYTGRVARVLRFIALNFNIAHTQCSVDEGNQMTQTQQQRLGVREVGKHFQFAGSNNSINGKYFQFVEVREVGEIVHDVVCVDRGEIEFAALIGEEESAERKINVKMKRARDCKWNKKILNKTSRGFSFFNITAGIGGGGGSGKRSNETDLAQPR
ncbi:hypothetical protein RND71_014007 [Anisodus tanguticus]|uniref:Uncharacterized protein n=1 Tax=Anisodus tanguticus TaxID=243964 RepID=A0AAE1VEQ0_9SOLA|nr:hypothetical protein RND71_014007 [Anisodus tanguticus]